MDPENPHDHLDIPASAEKLGVAMQLADCPDCDEPLEPTARSWRVWRDRVDAALWRDACRAAGDAVDATAEVAHALLRLAATSLQAAREELDGPAEGAAEETARAYRAAKARLLQDAAAAARDGLLRVGEQ